MCRFGGAGRDDGGNSRGEGGRGASGGIGKYRSGGETTCENVAEKYPGRMAVSPVSRALSYAYGVAIRTAWPRVDEAIVKH